MGQGKNLKLRFSAYVHIGQWVTLGYGWLAKVDNCPAGAINRKKANVKIRRNPQLWILPLIRTKYPRMKDEQTYELFQGYLSY